LDQRLITPVGAVLSLVIGQAIALIADESVVHGLLFAGGVAAAGIADQLWLRRRGSQ
jgi:hypothetical protein